MYFKESSRGQPSPRLAHYTLFRWQQRVQGPTERTQHLHHLPLATSRISCSCESRVINEIMLTSQPINMILSHEATPNGHPPEHFLQAGEWQALNGNALTLMNTLRCCFDARKRDFRSAPRALLIPSEPLHYGGTTELLSHQLQDRIRGLESLSSEFDV